MKDNTKEKIYIYSCVLILRVTQLQTEHQMCDPDWTGHLQEKLIKILFLAEALLARGILIDINNLRT